MSSLFMLAVAAAAPICTDRPAKANATCTVPALKVQLETSLIAWSLTDASGGRTRLVSLGSTVVKMGLTDRSDLQLGLTPYTRQTVSQGQARSTISGFGDLIVRYKHRLTPDDSRVQVAAIPFVKIPTADRGLGNEKLEGGLAVPVSFPIDGGATMTVGPEIDLLADADGRGRHAAVVNLINIAAPVAPRLTLAGELWSSFNFDPSGTTKQASVDVAFAYAFSGSLQFDAGGNFGITQSTPDAEIYVGTSIRF